MSLPERAVPRIHPSPAINEMDSPQDQDTEPRKPPRRSFDSPPDDKPTRDKDAGRDQSDCDDVIHRQCLSEEGSDQQSPAVMGLDPKGPSEKNMKAPQAKGLANGSKLPGNNPGDPASKLFSFPFRERLMNAQEVADHLGVSERWVRDHTTRRSPKIRGVKLGTLIRYRPADVEAFMDHLDTLRPSGHTRFGV